MAANTQTLIDGSRLITLHMTNSATTETDVVKLDASALTNPAGGTGGQTFSLLEIWYDIQGFAYVELAWDATTDREIITMSGGSGYMDFRDVGGVHDPKGTGYTGDILITTPTAAATETYTIKAVFKKKLD